MNYEGTALRRVPNVFGMNFQVVSVGQKLNETSIKEVGGYVDGVGKPSKPLLGEIQFVDAAIGKMVGELKSRGLYQQTVMPPQSAPTAARSSTAATWR